MRKTFIWLAASAMMCGAVWADLCSDLSTQYASLLTRLQQDTQAALSQTTDPAEQAAIRASFQAQQASLIAERDSTLAASNCVVNPGTGGTTPPPPTPTPAPTPTPSPTPAPNPGTGGTTPPPPPPPTTGGTDPGTGPTTGSGGTQACKDLMDQVKTEAQAKAASGGRKAAMAYLRSRQAEIKALCGSDSDNRCQRKDDDKTKCGRDEKPEKDDDKPKCDTKPDGHQDRDDSRGQEWDSRH